MTSSGRAGRLAFVMDPWQRMQVEEDTSYDLMACAQRLGHEVWHVDPRHLVLASGELRALATRLTFHQSEPVPVAAQEQRTLDLCHCDAVFIRKDPPFDPAYLWLTLMLEHLRDRVRFINDPRGLREANEKLYALRFPSVVPPTVVTAEGRVICEFVAAQNGRAVIKPIDGFAGASVYLLNRHDPNFNAIVEGLTREGQQAVMVQAYLPAVSEGDKRILLVDGKPLGAILRVPQGGDLRSNIHVGGKVAPATVDGRDEAIIAVLYENLKADGLRFVGIDVIGGCLTEVNVTSPTGLRQMSRFAGRELGEEALAALLAS